MVCTALIRYGSRGRDSRRKAQHKTRMYYLQFKDLVAMQGKGTVGIVVGLYQAIRADSSGFTYMR